MQKLQKLQKIKIFKLFLNILTFYKIKYIQFVLAGKEKTSTKVKQIKYSVALLETAFEDFKWSNGAQIGNYVFLC